MAGTEERDPLGKSWRTWGFILAGILVVVIAGLVLPQVLPGPSAAPPQTATTGLPSPTPSSATPEVPATSSPSAQPTSSTTPGQTFKKCPPLSTNNSFPVQAPQAKWMTHPAGTFLPVSKDYGPASRDGYFWRCFSRTTTGATFAGIGLLADFLSGEAIDSAVPSDKRDILFKPLVGQKQAAPRITGYKVINSSGKEATISYLYRDNDGVPAALKAVVVWDESAEDWRLDMERWKIQVGIDPDSYTAWGL